MSMKVSTAELSHNAREEKFAESERPPALGEEEHDFSSTRSSTSNQSQMSAASGKSTGDKSCGVHVASITPRKSALGIGMATMGCGERMSSLKDMSDEPPMGYEPEGSAATTPPFTETSTPPAYLKWAESLRGLLDDQEGTQLFRTYLAQEQCLDSLDFWFACNGLKKKSEHDEMEIQMIIRAIYNKYVRSSSSTLSMASETRKAIKRKVQSKSGLDQTVFDRAQAEVEATMSATTYPNFLRSDLYLQFVQGVQNGGADSPKLSDSGGGGSGSSSVSGGTRPNFGFLPTVDENKELNMSTSNPRTASLLPLTREHLCITQQRRAGYGYRKAEAHAGHYLQQSTTPLAHPYHAMYASCVPVSAQDSELQSLSSDAHTDDTMSLTDGSVDGMPTYPSKKYLRQQHHIMRQNASQNREIDHGHNLIPRTLRLPQGQMTPMEPSTFAAILTEKLEKVARERETQEKLHERLHKFHEMEEVAMPTAKPLPDDHLAIELSTGVLKMSITDELDHQSILDKHVDSLWNDESPHRTPPRRRSPDRRRASAPPTVPAFAGMHPAKGLVPPYPGSHHRHRREQDLVSTFSSDSGMVRDYAEGEFAGPPSTLPLPLEPPAGSGAPLYHHKLGAKSKMSPKSPSTVLPPEMSDVSARVVGYPPDPYMLPDGSLERERRPKDSSRRSSSKKMSAADSSSSCVDSGVSTAYETSLPPGIDSNDRVRCWIEGNEKFASFHHTDSEKDSTRHRKSSYSSMSATSPVASRPGRVKKPVAYNTSRSGSLDRGGGQGAWLLPSQPVAQDPLMPVLPPPNTTTQLEEARRRLEDDTRAKIARNKPNPCGKDKAVYIDVQKSRSSLGKGGYLGEIQEESGGTMKKSHKYSASLPSASNAPPASVTSENDFTVVGYYFCGDTVPYKTHLPGTNITLRQFKTLINTKKGNFRFFFKKASDEFGTGVVKEEISDDNQVLPLWDGKIFAVVETVD